MDEACELGSCPFGEGGVLQGLLETRFTLELLV